MLPVLVAATLVVTNWFVLFAQASFAWSVGAAVSVLLLERVVRCDAPSAFGWVRWRASLRHCAGVAAITLAVVIAWTLAVVAVARIGEFEILVDPHNIRDPGAFWGWFWFGSVWAPLVEEWIYRGLIQPRLREALGSRWAIFICGVLFWVYHWIPQGGVTMPHHLLAGWLFAWSWQRTGSLIAPTLLHALVNLGLGLIDMLLLTQPRLLGWLTGH